MAKPQRALLPPEEEEKLKQIATSGSPALRQRAQAVLAWHEGQTANDTAKRAKLSVNQVQYLWRLYRRKGLDLFMIDVEPTPVDSSLPAIPPEPEAPGTQTLESLLDDHNVDMAHARYVAALALQLFDATMVIHRLPQSMRPLLEAAALVHNLTYASDPEHHHITGRDVLLATPIRGLSDDERRILACTTAFHRKKVKPESEPSYQALPVELRRDALALTAILRVVDGIDYSQTQSTTLGDVQVSSEGITVLLTGTHAEDNAKQSQKKADVWNTVFTTPIRVQLTPEVEPPPAPVPAAPPRTVSIAPQSPSLNAGQSVSRAGNAFALHTLDRIDGLLRAVHSGDLNVLPALSREVSRLAEATQLANIKSFRKEIKAFGDAIEVARLKAALANRAAPLADEPGSVAAEIASRVNTWLAESQAAMRTDEIKAFGDVAAQLRSALAQPAAADEKTLISFQIGTTLWENLTALRTVMEHGTSVGEALEAVRRLQDHLIAFRGLLGPECAQVLDMLSPFESYLSTIYTTQSIMSQIEAQPVKKGRGRKPAVPPVDAAAEAIRKAQTEMLDMLADELPALWNGVNSPVFRRSFALAIAAP